MATFDFDSVRTYMEAMLVFLLIMSGTVLYNLRDTLPWLAPFVVLTYGLIFSGASLYQYVMLLRHQHKQDDKPIEGLKTIGAGILWVSWLVYGIVFRDVRPLIMMSGVSVAYVHGALVLGLVMLTYWQHDLRYNSLWANGIFLGSILLLFVPHTDTISHDMNPVVLFFKTVIFYVLYLLTEVRQILETERVFHDQVENNNSFSLNAQQERFRQIYRAEVKIVQSAWVLIASKYLLFGAIFQLLLLLGNIRRLKQGNKICHGTHTGPGGELKQSTSTQNFVHNQEDRTASQPHTPALAHGRPTKPTPSSLNSARKYEASTRRTIFQPGDVPAIAQKKGDGKRLQERSKVGRRPPPNQTSSTTTSKSVRGHNKKKARTTHVIVSLDATELDLKKVLEGE